MESKNKRSIGEEGENIAVGHLIKNGYKILKRNFRVGRMGEIDIIAFSKGYICFIEVKARSSTLYGTPAEAVGRSKQSSILRLANIYLSQNNSFDQNVRFDVIEILFSKNTSGQYTYSLNHIINAF